MQPLPIDPLLPDIVAALAGGRRLVLRAPPGAGKTTRVPAALLDAGLAGDKTVVVLEPRRIAARAAAEFVAAERGGKVGGVVGYRVRFESRGGAATRLWFVTEGVLGRQLLSDPFLEAVGIVVLDEFHERHLQGDVALAVIRELQDSVRPDLKLAVMSATLETERLAAYLGGCPVLTSQGKAHPVEIEYAEAIDDRPLPGRVATALRRVLDQPNEGGDCLVFLPGAAEIRRTGEAIAPIATAHQVDVVPLHGDLPLAAQQRAIQRGPRRKVVLSTNVAETALTIEGVTTVIDSGLARVARFDSRHGLNVLRVAPISRAAADQRAGRAGRVRPGRCLRLWTVAEHNGRRAYETPEVLRLELSGTLLELRAWGATDVQGFGWLDPPGAPALQRAAQLLVQLGAIDTASGKLTDIGRRVLALSVPPRLGRMLVEAEQRGCREAGALLAALASERDICLEQRAFGAGASRAATSGQSDLLERMELFAHAAKAGFEANACRARGLEARSLRAVERARRQLSGTSRAPDVAGMTTRTTAEALMRCTLAGFPDRVVRRRAPGSPRGVMTGGTGVVLADSSVVREAELFVAVEVEAGAQRRLSEARVRIAGAIERAWLEEMFPQSFTRTSELVFDPERERVIERVRQCYHDLVLDEQLRFDVDRSRAGVVLASVARGDPARAAVPSAAVWQLLARIDFLRRWLPELGWPADTGALLAEAVAALCLGRCSFSEVRSADLLGALRALLSHQQRAALEREAPAEYRLPAGRCAAVHYDATKPPAVAARIQELFGLTSTPRLAGGRVPLVIELLAPNQRPVQITDDLASFWRTTYPEVRKQLRGRYPKHAWPDDPLSAPPTSRAVRRRH
ncbi:MAG: ATP-dependent helicase HrpB [Deltaproteobacteria bacterium]|nr:ATP-dependent helicase HrpB [Deltaproteobacteria bacterium]